MYSVARTKSRIEEMKSCISVYVTWGVLPDDYKVKGEIVA